jgi:hypothetical protein
VFFVPIMFQSCSQKFPKIFSIAPQIYHVTICPKLNSHVYKLKSLDIGEHIGFYFEIGVQKGASIGVLGECPMFQKPCTSN